MKRFLNIDGSLKKSSHSWKPVSSPTLIIIKLWIPAFAVMTMCRDFWLFGRSSILARKVGGIY